MIQIQVLTPDSKDGSTSLGRISSIWLDSPAIVVAWLPRPGPDEKTTAQAWIDELWRRGFREVHPNSNAYLPEGEPAIFARGLFNIRASTNTLEVDDGENPVFVTTLCAST